MSSGQEIHQHHHSNLSPTHPPEQVPIGLYLSISLLPSAVSAFDTYYPSFFNLLSDLVSLPSCSAGSHSPRIAIRGRKSTPAPRWVPKSTHQESKKGARRKGLKKAVRVLAASSFPTFSSHPPSAYICPICPSVCFTRNR